MVPSYSSDFGKGERFTAEHITAINGSIETYEIFIWSGDGKSQFTQQYPAHHEQGWENPGILSYHHYWFHFRDLPHVYRDPPSYHGPGPARGLALLDSGSGRGLVSRNRGRDVHPCEERTLRGLVGVMESEGDEEENGHGGGHDRNQSARMQMEEYGPTIQMLNV